MKRVFHPYHYHGNLLMAVPAVHQQSAFAQQVHDICRSAQNRPDAIAVELGHSLVNELVNFLRDLKQGGSEKIILPCMMGILMQNRYLHPDYREKALLLQAFYRSPLYELPDEILSERLNFSKWSTLFISPADSIIEAVRCALELNIPVYGIDIPDTPGITRGNYRLEDPQAAGTEILEYGKRVMKYCDAGRDARIDLNREVYMAAGLKHCLEKHQRVLFTCGMAHWKSLLLLLNDKEVRPFPVHETREKTEFRRVIIHPSLAVPAMEVIPQLTFDYERFRRPVTTKKKYNGVINPDQRIRRCLDETYKNYTDISYSGELNISGASRWSNIGQYEQYLFHLSSVRQRHLPDSGSMLTAAEVMMDEEFCRILTKQLMTVVPSWASSDDFPDLPLLYNVTGRNRNGKNSNKRVRMQTTTQSGDAGEEINTKEFYIRVPEPSVQGLGEVSRYWDEDRPEKENKGSLWHGIAWVWPPCESLLYGLAYKAAEISNVNQRMFNSSKAFDGALEGGIDVKGTIRSIIRGEKKVYVNRLASDREQSLIDGKKSDPFVFIFPGTSDLANARWSYYTAGFNLKQEVKDIQLYSKILREQGDTFVASISLDEKKPPPQHLKSLVHEVIKTYGTVMFGNPCINAKQSAIWLETSGYKCCPIIPNRNMDAVWLYYRQNFNLEMNLNNWQESLIRMAIPFANRMVTIIADDTLRITERARIEASQKRVMLNIVNFSNFSKPQLEQARNRLTIWTLDMAGNEFPPETEEVLGQKKDLYFEMLPLAVRKQVGFPE